MTDRKYAGPTIAALALGALIVSSPTALAITGAGCPDLPEYARAVGTIELGEGACNMTTAEARRIIAREQGQAAPAEAAPAPRHSSRKHHRTKRAHP